MSEDLKQRISEFLDGILTNGNSAGADMWTAVGLLREVIEECNR